MTDRPVLSVDGRLRWLPPVGVLALSAVLYAVSRWLPVVTTADGSTPSAPVAGWWIGLPVLVAVLVATRCGTGAAAVVLGAGAVAAGRLVADLGLLLAPDAALRPELFGVDSLAAFPLGPGPGSAVVLAADLLALLAAGLATRTALAGWEPPMGRTGPASGDPGRADPERARTLRSGPAPLIGLVAVALVVVSSLGVLYASPLPVVRPLGLADIGVPGLSGALLAGLLIGGVVVLASSVPVRAARGLYLGSGAAAAVAPLTALTAGGDINPSGLAWVGIAGAVLLAAAGLVVRDPGDHPSAVPSAADDRWIRVAGPGVGVLTLLAAGAALLAYRAPQATTVLGEQLASFDAAGAAFLPSAVVLGLIGVSAVIPVAARWARLALRLGWLPVVAAVLVSLEFSSSSVWVSSAIFGAGGVQRAAGSWWGILAAVLAVLAVVLAGVLDPRLSLDEEAPERPDGADRLRSTVAGLLSTLAVAAFAFPVLIANDRPAAALFVGDARVDTYGAWMLTVGLVAGIWAGCRHPRRAGTVTLLLTVAAVAATRVALTPAVVHQVHFEVRPGLVLTAVLVVAAVVAAGVLGGRPSTAVTSPALEVPTAKAVAGSRRNRA